MVKLSSFMIAAVLGSLFIVVFTTFIADNYTAYNPTSYDNTTLAQFDKLANMSANTEAVQTELVDIQQDAGVFDVIGGFFSAGYRSMQLAVNSYTVVEGMTEDALDSAGVLGGGSGYIKTAIITILLISLFVGVILSAIIKKDV